MTIDHERHVSRAEYHLMLSKRTSEDELQRKIIILAEKLGWLVYHTHDSRRSQPGYPDLHLVHPSAGRSIYRELKVQSLSKGVVKPDQQKWLEALAACGDDVGVWRPLDYYDGTIERTLRVEVTL